MDVVTLTLSKSIKERIAAAREELRNQTPNREIVNAHLDSAEALFDALLETIPVEVPDSLRQ